MADQSNTTTDAPKPWTVRDAVTDTKGVPVRRIETISYANVPEGEPGEPFWRIVLNGYCADFHSETAARNFADQILAVKEQP